MEKVTVAIDVDGTLIGLNETEADEDIRTLLRILHSFRNVWIVLWSGSGELWARQAARIIHADQWVDQYATKADKSIHPDITIDDMEDMSMGVYNLIVPLKQ